ncbi:MAG: exonuclease domain-containing protein [Bacillota bacterium]
MPTVFGKIIDLDSKRRTIDIIHRRKKKTCYFQRSQFNTFGSFLRPGHFVVLNVSNPKRKRDYKAYVVKDVKKIFQSLLGKRRVLFSTDKLKEEIRTFIDGLESKLFLDFEMSMHPYSVDKSFKQEIIQVGYILVDANDRVIREYETYIQPTRHKKLSKRTLKFLALDQADVDKGVPFSAFYNHLKKLLIDHDPAIIVWGKNDFLSLDEAYQINDLPSLANESRFVNLLQLHKNYFRYKDDVGLKTAFTMYGNTLETQRHDAYEDAWMTKKIFEGFKDWIHHHEGDPLR